RVSELITKIAKARTTVLITGESGTGKERVARSLGSLTLEPLASRPRDARLFPEPKRRAPPNERPLR
ncbi:MAG TPA: sigma 54-interacting transcriptional regulator, partial [Fimbriimonadaceae bacterium]|nr:sigma 54-interacting transcriptional regulator [Fimbriimonadaceae bacterium]